MGTADCPARPGPSCCRPGARWAGRRRRWWRGCSRTASTALIPDACRPGAAEAAASIAATVAFSRPSAETPSGVWRDFAIRKRRTELDVQVAPAAGIGARHGLPCPATRKLVALIHAVEAGCPHSDDLLLEPLT